MTFIFKPTGGKVATMSSIAVPEGYTLIHSYKNGNIKVARRERCFKCNGSGKIGYFAHIYGGECFECRGSGVVTVTEILKTPENEARDRAKAEAKAEQLRLEAEAKAQAEREAEAKRQAELDEKRAISQHVGAVGDKVQLELVLVYSARWEQASYSGYGSTTYHRHILRDDLGNVFTWKTTNTLNIEQADGSYLVAEQGDRVTLKGTIKAHGDYQGEKQTELTRCKTLSITGKEN